MGSRLSVVRSVISVKRLYWKYFGLKSKKIELSNGTTMHCWILKSSSKDGPKQSVLLIHGFGAEGLTGWEKQIGALSERFDVYIPDLIFFGDSTTNSEERSEIFQAECMKSMLDILEVKSVVAVGHSYGGFVAFWMAHRYPHLVSRVAIVSSGVCMTPSSNDALLREFGASDIKEILLPTTVEDFKRALDLTFYKMPRLPDFIYKDFMETAGGKREQRAELVDGMVIGSKNSQPLPLLNQEVLIIWGKNDKIFEIELAYRLQRHIGEKAKVVVMEECGHVPSMEKAGELNEALLEFLIGHS